jgi:hypothetical protein
MRRRLLIAGLVLLVLALASLGFMTGVATGRKPRYAV